MKSRLMVMYYLVKFQHYPTKSHLMMMYYTVKSQHYPMKSQQMTVHYPWNLTITQWNLTGWWNWWSKIHRSRRGLSALVNWDHSDPWNLEIWREKKLCAQCFFRMLVTYESYVSPGGMAALTYENQMFRTYCSFERVSSHWKSVTKLLEINLVAA